MLRRLMFNSDRTIRRLVTSRSLRHMVVGASLRLPARCLLLLIFLALVDCFTGGPPGRARGLLRCCGVGAHDSAPMCMNPLACVVYHYLRPNWFLSSWRC